MKANMPDVLVDELVIDVIQKSHAEQFFKKIVFALQVRRFEHFLHIQEKDMIKVGIPNEIIKNLQANITQTNRELWNRSSQKQVIVRNDEPSTNETIETRALIPSNQIAIYEKLGEGTFAVVKRGVWTQPNGTKYDVAVKILRGITANVMEELKIEASHLLKLHHPSLIRLHGIVQQPAMMVFELCEGGSLLDRLRNDKKDVLLVSQLLDYCVQIAKALQFLESKKCVHRDVAARNILLTKNEESVKICDFGLMRALKDNEQMYTMGPQKKVPFAWCPPEALRHRKFSSASDVWSYGVTIWEIFTFGEEPWYGCRAVDVLKNIDAGERLEKPKYCSQKLYQIMLKCWSKDPQMRIKFYAIREDLKAASFLNAIVREPYESTKSEHLKLKKNDEIIVIENESQEWYGQHKHNKHFGHFPRSCVFVSSNNVENVVLTSTTSKTPFVPSLKAPFSKIPFVTPISTEPSLKHSEISMPIQGSFIHTGHGDSFGEQSWGSPSAIDEVYLKNPMKGVPLIRLYNGAEVRKKNDEISNIKKIKVASSELPGTSLSLCDPGDEFEKAFNENFSPTEIEYPRILADTNRNANQPTFQKQEKLNSNGKISNPIPTMNPHQYPHNHIFETSVPSSSDFSSSTSRNMHSIHNDSQKKPNIVHDQPRQVSSAGSRLENMGLFSESLTRSDKQKIETSLRKNLDTIGRPRPASSTGILNSRELQSFDSVFLKTTRPATVLTVDSSVNPVIKTDQLPCLIPTPIYPQKIVPKMAQQNPNQKSITEELKKTIHRNDQNNGRFKNTEAASEVPLVKNEQPTIRPTIPQRRDPIMKVNPTEKPKEPDASIDAQKSIKQDSSTAIHPIFVPTHMNNQKQTPETNSPVKSNTINDNTTTTVKKRSQPIQASSRDEERRSRIQNEIASMLPAPSPLLLGLAEPTVVSTRSASSSASNQSLQNPPQNVNQTSVAKKHTEPVLSMTSVLQPTRLPSADSVIKQTKQQNLNLEKTYHTSILNRPENKPMVSMPTTQVPLYNLTNSNMYSTSSVYPCLGVMPQQYGIGFSSSLGHTGAYSSFYNPYSNHVVPTYNPYLVQPPLLPSLPKFQLENRPVAPSSTVDLQPLDESDIQELLGQARQEASTSATIEKEMKNEPGLSMARKMEILYQEASFTHQSNCDSMVNKCKGDVQLALKRLKEQHLVELNLVSSMEKARQVLEAENYDLTKAANSCLGN